MNYTCPHCGRPTTITEPNKYSDWNHISIQTSTHGPVGFGIAAITCPNEECQQLTLEARLTTSVYRAGVGHREGTEMKSWRLLPESEAKVLPSYIPAPIQDDYYESCRIRDLSPKASATLSRRCLQGMIRDFHGISGRRLVDEINELKDKIHPDVWESIEAVRKVGNIGAHMEQDINTIIEVEPHEAQLLIGLNEQLIDDWYVAREARKIRTASMKTLVAEKEAKRADK